MSTAKELNYQEKFKEIKAGDIMSKHAITVEEDEPIADIAHLMMRFKLSGLPVVNIHGKIIGIITTTDLFSQIDQMHLTKNNEEISKYYIKPVQSIMSKDVLSVTRDQNLDDIIDLVCKKNIHTIPVVENDTIIGIIGRRDIINACYVMTRDLAERSA